MNGLVSFTHECMEKLVIDKFGLESWQAVQRQAGLPLVCRNSLATSTSMVSLHQHEHQTAPTNSTVDLVKAASQVTGHSSDDLLVALGEFVVHHLQDEGYDQWLRCPGKSLRSWLGNLNAIQQHLELVFRPAKNVTEEDVKKSGLTSSLPRFYCQEDDNGSLLFRCSFPEDSSSSSRAKASARRKELSWWTAPIVKGMVSEVAGTLFDVEIQIGQLMKPEGDISHDIVWRIAAMDSKDQWKLHRTSPATTTMTDKENIPTRVTAKCPETGMPTISTEQPEDDGATSSADIGLSGIITKTLFPYHVIVDCEFNIQQVGNQIPKVLQATLSLLIGQNIAKYFSIKRRQKGTDSGWNWQQLCWQEGQSFQVETATHLSPSTASPMSFKTTVIQLSNDASSESVSSSSPPLIMLILNPEFADLADIGEHGFSLSDISVHNSAHRELILAREHLQSLQERQTCMEELGCSLERERNLLESLLPSHAAEGLRAGKSVEPMLHNDVTFFFSDIVNFTAICRQISPWQVIEMLNQLYSVCDFLATKMGIFKIETIGDAYVCCSGLPEKDENHAFNVGNFAIAVRHCCRHVLSPVDGVPIKLRIGINSGPATSGVVGSLAPRFCVFGDTVNTTARHESSGLPEMIHCSGSTKIELQEQHNGMFQITERGKVEMKGKGQMTTYWLEASESNLLVNRAALQQLDIEVKELLSKTNFKTKMGLSSHPSMLGLLEEREKQGLLTRIGSTISFGNSLGSASSVDRRNASCVVARSGSALGKLGSFVETFANNMPKLDHSSVTNADGRSHLKALCGGSACGTSSAPKKRQAANADWTAASVTSSSTGSHQSKKQRDETNGCLHRLDLKMPGKICREISRGPASDMMRNSILNISGECTTETTSASTESRRGSGSSRGSGKLFDIAERCKAAAMEESLSKFDFVDFPHIPDSI